MQRILVIAAHPDDEVLGCGGTICKHVAQGDLVSVLYLSEGVSSRDVLDPSKDWTKEIEEREQFAINACKVMGADIAGFLRYKNLRMCDDSMLDIAKNIMKVIAVFQPLVIYTHAGGDMNSDHRVVNEAVITACRPVGGLSVKRIYSFEVCSSTEWSSTSIGEYFIPVKYVDVSAYMQQKQDAVECYDFEMRPYPHPRSRENIKALSQVRGMAVGLNAAEAFMIIREID